MPRRTRPRTAQSTRPRPATSGAMHGVDGVVHVRADLDLRAFSFGFAKHVPHLPDVAGEHELDTGSFEISDELFNHFDRRDVDGCDRLRIDHDRMSTR